MILSATSAVPAGTPAQKLQALFGLLCFMLIAGIIGRIRGARGIPWRVIVWGTVLQFAFGAIVIFSPDVLTVVQLAINRLLEFSNAGGRLVFGNLIDPALRVTPDAEGRQTLLGFAQSGFVFAFSVLPTIIFISMLTAILYHIGLLTLIVRGLAWLMQKTMGTSGAETLSTVANIFVGQTEAPLIVRPFLALATRSELMAIMVGGFSNIATGVLVLYAGLLRDFVPSAGGHLALACFISAPATLVVSKLMMPETAVPQTAGSVDVRVERPDANIIDAATRGTSEGLALALNVAAMLIAFTSLVALLNYLFGTATGWFGLGTASVVDGRTVYAGIRLEQLLGYALAPMAWLCGVEWQYCSKVGSLLGVKTVLNEFLAYFEMSTRMGQDASWLSPRAALISTYALCGFANFASVGIQIGGISSLAPGRRHDLSRIGLLAMAGGAIATMMGACVVAVLT